MYQKKMNKHFNDGEGNLSVNIERRLFCNGRH